MIGVWKGPGPASALVEIVERKGLGHPDKLADALAERMSAAYSRTVLAGTMDHQLTLKCGDGNPVRGKRC
jgi:S-adenosylmethionine synthetase